jgi:hypothetical protein
LSARKSIPGKAVREISAADINLVLSHLGDNVQIEGMMPGWADARVLDLRWKGESNDWLLIEDEETSESYREDSR